MADISKITLSNITYNIKDAFAREAIEELGDALVFKGTIGSETQGSGTIDHIPTSNVTVGDTWLIVDEARTLSAEYSSTGESVLLDIGDSIIATSSNPVLYATSASKDEIGVTSIAAGNGLTGGTITTSGTIAIDFNSVQQKLTSGTTIKTINNETLLGSGNISLVPSTRKINNKELSSDITLSASDVNAIPTSGGNVSGDLIFAKQKGVWGTDSTDYNYPLIFDNSTNIWIGASKSATQHHKGGVYISSGMGTSGPNNSIFVSVPNSTNTGATNYRVYHEGYKPTASNLGITVDSVSASGNDIPLEAFRYRGGAEGDIDDFKGLDKLGYYSASSTLTGNKPTAYGILLVFRRYSDTVQLWIATNSQLYIRNYSASNGWTSWLTHVYGIKGNAESTYRTGQVNLTPANIGAVNQDNGVLKFPIGDESKYVAFRSGGSSPNKVLQPYVYNASTGAYISSSGILVTSDGSRNWAYPSEVGSVQIADIQVVKLSASGNTALYGLKELTGTLTPVSGATAYYTFPYYSQYGILATSIVRNNNTLTASYRQVGYSGSVAMDAYVTVLAVKVR